MGAMQDVLDLLAFIAENMGKGKGIERIKEILGEKGYGKNEINLALNYFLFTSSTHEESGLCGTRILHPIEDMFISAEAYGHLLKLRALRIIDDVQLERIIEEALTETDHLVGISEMKKAAYEVLFHTTETDYPVPLSGKDEENTPIH